jgi:hypothetical protein
MVSPKKKMLTLITRLHAGILRNLIINTVGLGMAIRVPDLTDTGTIFYPQVALVPDLNRDGYETGIFFHPRVARWVPDTLLLL